MDIKSLTPGSIENAAPKTIDYKGHNHMYRRAVVGNTPVYYAGILNVGGTEYVYYVTSQKTTERTVYSVLNVGCNQKILVKYKKVTTFKFSAEAWLKTQYANKNPREIRITNVTPTGTFNDDHSYTWKFTGSTAGGNTFEMNQLELNGEAIEVPMVTMKDTEAITSTTILSTGTVVTISVASNHGTNGKDAQRDYAVKIENCYEDITVSGGNLSLIHI